MTPTPGCYALTTTPVTRDAGGFWSSPRVVAPAGTWGVVRRVTGILSTRVTVVFLGSGVEAEASEHAFEFYADAPAERAVRPVAAT